MCLDLYTARKPVAKIAEKNITVFKTIRNGGYGVFNNLYIKNQAVRWIAGSMYSETDFSKCIIGRYRNWSIGGNALHSGITISRALGIRERKYDTKVVKMIIPKGAKYFKGDEDYASSHLVYPPQKQFDKYLEYEYIL